MTWINLFNGILQNLNWGVSHMNLIYCANGSAIADFKIHQLWKCDYDKIYLLTKQSYKHLNAKKKEAEERGA